MEEIIRGKSRPLASSALPVAIGLSLALRAVVLSGQSPPGRCPDTSTSVIKLLPPPQAMQPNVQLNDTTAYQECAVDQPAVIHPSPYPTFPPRLAAAGVSGIVGVGFTVLTSGAIDATHLVVYRSTHAWFTGAVRDAVRQWTARPARIGRRAVPQWLEYDFHFIADCRGPPRAAPRERSAGRAHVVEICATPE